jgi:hypothetical protein
VSQDVSRFRVNEMAAIPQQNPYQCDQCGTPNIVAVPLLYQQGTRTYSGLTTWGSSQSYSAQLSAPPRPRGYARAFFSGDLLSISLAFGPTLVLARASNIQTIRPWNIRSPFFYSWDSFAS